MKESVCRHPPATGGAMLAEQDECRTRGNVRATCAAQRSARYEVEDKVIYLGQAIRQRQRLWPADICASGKRSYSRREVSGRWCLRPQAFPTDKATFDSAATCIPGVQYLLSTARFGPSIGGNYTEKFAGAVLRHARKRMEL